jgi:hypothetical protein
MSPVCHRCFIERRGRWSWQAECSCGWMGRERWHPLLAEREADTHLAASTQPPSPQETDRKKAEPGKCPTPHCAYGEGHKGECVVCPPSSPQAEVQDCERCLGEGKVRIRHALITCPDCTGKQPPTEPQGDVVEGGYCDQCERSRHEAVPVGNESEESLCAECLLTRFNAERNQADA